MTECPKCKAKRFVTTNICHKKNLVLECRYGQQNAPHKHYWCIWCGHEWVEVKGNVDGLSVRPHYVAPRA